MAKDKGKEEEPAKPTLPPRKTPDVQMPQFLAMLAAAAAFIEVCGGYDNALSTLQNLPEAKRGG